MKRFRPFLSAALALVLSGCISVGGGSKPPVQPPTPPPDVAVTIAVVLHDFVAPTVAIADATVTCTPDAVDNAPRIGTTNQDGFLNFDVPLKRSVNCAFSREGYEPNTATFFPEEGSTLFGASMTRKVLPPPPPPPFTVSRNARQGRLRLDGNGFRDQSGPVNPVYAHAGDLFSLYTRNPARALQQLDKVAEAGYQGIRVWSTLGCGPNTGAGCPHGAFWLGREVGPDVTPDYWGKVREFALALRDRGLRAVWSQGDVGQLSDRRAYMSRLASLDNEVDGFIDFIDCGNEAWQTGEPDPARLAQCVRYYMDAGGQAIRSLTSPPSEDKADLDAFSIDPAQVFDVHSFRDNHWFDKRRHIFSVNYENPPMRGFGIQSEPAGNGRLVSASANKEELDNEAVPLLAVTSLYARQAFVWFSGEGVKIDQGLETEAGFWTTPTATDWVPKDVMSFERIHHSGERFRGVRILAATGQARVDCRTSDMGRFVCTLDGPSGSYSFQVERGFNARLCNPGTSTCEDVSKNPGDVLPVSWNRGRVLVGQVR